MKYEIVDWLSFGLVLAVILLLTIGLAVITRVVSKSKIRGQTFWLVMLGTVIVLGTMGFVVGWTTIGLFVVAYGVAAIPMGVEYFWRVAEEQNKANAEIEKGI